jgi:hypothetical protein
MSTLEVELLAKRRGLKDGDIMSDRETFYWWWLNDPATP